MPRTKTCIICGTPHTNTMNKTCSPKCERTHRANLAKVNKEKIKVKKEKAKEKKAFKRSALIKEADICWSLYIRERDKGLPCITCGTAWNDTFNAGHFMSRRYLNTRWEMFNGAGQCIRCNNWGAGEQYEFSIALEKKSPGLPEQLRRLAYCNDKVTDEEILCYIRILYIELSKMAVEYKPKKIYLKTY